MLEGLQLTPLESRCYEILVALPERSIDHLVDRADARSGDVRAALARLADRGLVTIADGGERLVPAPPEVAVELLIRQQQERHERARVYAAELTERYRAGGSPGEVDEHVELVQGRAAVAQRFEQLQRAAREEVIVFVKPPFITPTDDQAATEEAVLANGVQVRGIYERTALEDPEDTSQIARLLADGEQARVVAEVPFKLAIADRSLGLLPFDPDSSLGETAFLVHPCGLLTGLIALAEALWQVGAPVSPAAADAELPLAGSAEDPDHAVLRLLQAGLTDAAIARRLGASERTIGRRVRRLMDRSGAQTRFQLGWRAAERGWLEESEPVP